MSPAAEPARPVVLTWMAYYLPGYKAGGALRTLLGLVEALGDEFEFRIVTRDRDYESPDPYPDVETDTWTRVGKAWVMYVPPERVTPGAIARIARATPHDLVYFPSFLDPRFTITPLALRRLGRIPRAPVVVAPQNELSPGALSLKAWKKRAFLAAAKRMGLYADVTFHASSALERDEIRALFPAARIQVARNLLSIPSGAERSEPAPKEAGVLRAVFLSRINAKKNLSGVLAMLGQPALEGRIELDIYGPVDDPAHWAECEWAIEALPDHVTVNVRGPLENHRIPEVLPDYHLFMLPTLGESFGYAILEAMLWGCPVLISDRTPWQGLEAGGAGWEFPLESPERFIEALRHCIALDAEGFARLSRSTREYAFDYVRASDQIDENRRLLLDALGRS